MPYKTIDDLPDSVKDQYTEAEQEQFLEVFNSAFETCMDDGGTESECEGSAMAQAHGAVGGEEEEARNVSDEERTMKKSPVQVFMGKIERWLNELFQEKERAVSMDEVYYQVWDAAEEVDPWAWLNNLYYEDDGQPFAIITSQGKLFRANVTIANGMVELGEWVEVKIDFPPVTQSRMIVHRQADGKVRWFSIASSNALNRSGEIDSRELFQSFSEHIEETGEYPIRMFYHAGGVFRTGQHDFVGTYETEDGVSLLITSGLYDDTELARREVEAREKDPTYWGNSIGFLPTELPEMLEVTDGVEIPVYTRGILKEESTLPEDSAAAWMTAVPTLTEVERMLKENQLDAFIKLFDGDEEAAQAWLEENAAERARQIADAGMVRRETDTEPETDGAEPTSEPVEEQNVSLDEDAVAAIARAIVESETFTGLINPLTERMIALETRLDEFATRFDAQAEETTQARAGLGKRLEALEADDETKRSTWLSDLPASKKNGLNVTYRPRNRKKGGENKQSTMDDIAADTLSRAPVQY